MKIGFATPVSLRQMTDLVEGGERLPRGYEFAPSVDWVRELLRRGHQVVVYTSARDVNEAQAFHGERLTIRIAAQRASGTGRDFAKRERDQLRRMMLEDRCDVLHAHWTYEFALAALSTGLPTLVTVHDLPWNVLRFFRDGYRAARLLMAYAVALRGKHFTSVSSDAARHFQDYFAPWTEVDVIPNGLPDAVFAMAPQRDSARVECAFATVLQGWSVRKNGTAALLAFRKVQAVLPGARLLMFGRDYEANGPAEGWAKERGCAEGVTFVGQMPYGELLHCIATQADILVHPSLDESFSMAALEAMALRKPVIAGRDTPGVREVLGYGTAGVLVDVTDVSEIIEAMLHLAMDLDFRARMGRLGFERAWHHYRTTVVFDQYEALYRRIGGSRAAVA